jgi:hypothetical protein
VARAEAAIARYARQVAARKVVPIRPPKPSPKGGPRSHLVIPDMQLKPWAPIEHCAWVGAYIADRRPNVVVNLGDMADMPSLNSHAAAEELEDSTVLDDLAVVRDGVALLTREIRKPKGYRPELHITLGNHEGRLYRLVAESPKLRGIYGADPFGYIEHGWTVHDFLRPVVIDGCAYSHFFPRGANGRITQSRRGAPSAATMAKREMKTSIAGHQQGLDMAVVHTGDGRTVWGIIAGSCYLHAEDYLTPQGNAHWRGVLVLHDVNDGAFDPMVVSMDFLWRRFGKRWKPKPWVPKG